MPLREAVYRALRDELMNGAVKFGERLTEPKLSARFGVSRTPVREALGLLCADGLLRREEYGFSPVRPSIPKILDLYELRLTIELGALRRVADNPGLAHDRAALLRLRGEWTALRDDPPAQEPGFVVRDEGFHEALCAAAGNAELARALASANSRIRHVRMFDFMANARVETTIAEHLEILGAVLDGDLELAQRLLRAHIGESLDVVLGRVSRAMATMSMDSD